VANEVKRYLAEIGSKGGKVKGRQKARSPEFYKELSRQGVEARKARSAAVCACGHDYAQHSKGPVQADYCRHCDCTHWQPVTADSGTGGKK
jgi:general stress protein YciG